MYVRTSLGSTLGSIYSPHTVHIPYTVKTMRQLLHVRFYVHMYMYIIHFTLHGNCDGVQHWVQEERRENVHACSADLIQTAFGIPMDVHACTCTYVRICTA